MITLLEGAQIASILQIFVIAGVIWQGYLLYKQMKADHERSRREKSVEILFQWSNNLQEGNSLARKIVESLNEEQARNLLNQEPICIHKKFLDSIKKLLEIEKDDALKIDNDCIELTESQASKLRWYTLSFLNLLESVLIAWQYSIVDREIIENEFSYLFSAKDGHAALKHFRHAAGGEEAFPAIEVFSNHIEDLRKKKLKDKSKIV